MSSRLGPIEICCDAPPYPIVRACRRIGMHRPEDVRWLRLSEPESGRGSPSGSRKARRKPGSREPGICTCGEPMPGLPLVVFTLSTGNEVSYFLGQCSRCRTIFWAEP